jgi:hypothetical protein
MLGLLVLVRRWGAPPPGSVIRRSRRPMNGAALRQMRNVRCLFGLNGFLEFLSRNVGDTQRRFALTLR